MNLRTQKLFVLHLLMLIASGTLASSSEAAPIDFIVQTQQGVNPATLSAKYAITLKDRAPGGAPFALFVTDSTRVEALEEALRADKSVAWVEIEEQIGLSESDTTSRGGTIPVVGSVDHLDNENAHLLKQIHWNPTFRLLNLAQVKVAILDTGISPLAKGIWGKTIRYRNQIAPFLTTNTTDFDLPDPKYPLASSRNKAVGHGTMVAGLITELAPNSQLIIERVADGSGTASSWTIIRGLADAVAVHASVLNISLGAPGPLVALEQAFAWAQGKGLTVVAPAGNDNRGRLIEPAALEGVISVAGVDEADVKAPFSDWSPDAVACAPAVGVRSVNWDGKMAIWSGTSFSAPLVTGALCLSIGMGKPVSNRNAAAYLLRTGDSVDTLNIPFKGQLGRRLDLYHLVHASPPVEIP